MEIKAIILFAIFMIILFLININNIMLFQVVDKGLK